jgi:hypothetical protein
MVMWALARKTCESLQNSVIPLSLEIMRLDQIVNMSLNGLRRRVSTRDKTLTGPQMDELSLALYSRQRVSSRGVPLLSFHCLEKRLLEDLSN